jgi:murein tripeptide amidase MpaA
VSPAIAARFPEPDVAFSTPAFAAGRTAFTNNDELHVFLDGLTRNARAARGGTAIEVLPIGASQRGTPIEVLAFTRPYVAPAVAAASGAAAAIGRRPGVVIIAGQHGDEPAGTEALLVVAQQLAEGRFERVLEQADVFLLPRANPDGAAAGQRAAADGTDLDLDHLLLRTPEAQAEAELIRGVAPLWCSACTSTRSTRRCG